MTLLLLLFCHLLTTLSIRECHTHTHIAESNFSSSSIVLCCVLCVRALSFRKYVANSFQFTVWHCIYHIFFLFRRFYARSCALSLSPFLSVCVRCNPTYILLSMFVINSECINRIHTSAYISDMLEIMCRTFILLYYFFPPFYTVTEKKPNRIP